MTPATSPSLVVATTIKQQLGHGALVMLGATNFIGSDRALSFKIAGSRSVSHIRITLEPSDTYRVEFIKCARYDFKTVADLTGLYADALLGAIENHTGLRTSL